MTQWRMIWPLAAAALLGAAILGGHAARADGELSAAETEALKAKLKQEILDELLEEGRLDPAIDAGIKRYVERQRRERAESEARREQESAELAKNVRKVSAKRDHVYGNPDALVSIIEYSDFECPFCKRFHPTAKKLVDAYDGKVNWVYRHFPLAFHNPGAQLQAEASECAAELGGNDAFWNYTDTIYERTTSNGKGFPIAGLIPLAREIGLDGDDFAKCLDERRYTDRVKEDYEEGLRVGIRGTPGNILLHNRSGEVISRPGAVPFNTLKRLIDSLLEEERAS